MILQAYYLPPIPGSQSSKLNNSDVLLDVPDSTYQTKRFRKQPVNVHSWGPLFTGSLTEIETGIYSQDVLSSTSLFAGLEFDNVGNIKGVGRVSYQGLYSIIDITTSYGKRISDRNTFFVENDTIFQFKEENLSWNEGTFKAGVRFPFLLTKSKFNAKIEMYNYVGVTSISNFTSIVQDKDIVFTNLLNNGMLVQNEFVITWYNLLNQSKRDIFSKWGQTFTIENYSTPFGGDFTGGLTALKSQLYFPGFANHHSINFFAGYQYQKFTLSANEYFFNNRMPFPRGHAAQSFENFYTIRSNYDLPLLHPDLRMGPFLYIQRVKAKLFYDYGYGKTDVQNTSNGIKSQVTRSFQSTGIDLTFDFNVMRALPLLELGVRAVYLPDTQETKFEFLIGSIGF